MNKTLTEWVEMPYSEFDLAANKLTGQQARDLAVSLEWLSCRAAVANAYLDTRFGLDGTGKHDHKDGKKAVNRMWRKVRGLFGFTPKKQRDIM